AVLFDNIHIALIDEWRRRGWSRFGQRPGDTLAGSLCGFGRNVSGGGCLDGEERAAGAAATTAAGSPSWPARSAASAAARSTRSAAWKTEAAAGSATDTDDQSFLIPDRRRMTLPAAGAQLPQ